MEAETTFVRANHIVVLNAVTHVCLYVTLVVYPCHTELYQAIWDAESLNKICFLELRMLVVLFFYCTQHLTYCLNVLRLIRESLL